MKIKRNRDNVKLPKDVFTVLSVRWKKGWGVQRAQHALCQVRWDQAIHSQEAIVGMPRFFVYEPSDQRIHIFPCPSVRGELFIEYTTRRVL